MVKDTRGYLYGYYCCMDTMQLCLVQHTSLHVYSACIQLVKLISDNNVLSHAPSHIFQSVKIITQIQVQYNKKQNTHVSLVCIHKRVMTVRKKS